MIDRIRKRGMWTCRKHSVHNRQPTEQHKTKTWKQHECKMLKYTEDSQKQETKHLLRERREYRLGTVSDNDTKGV